MADFIIKYWLQFIFSLISVAITSGFIWLFNYLINIGRSIRALMHDRLYCLCPIYMKQGWCSIEDKRNLEYLYKPYKFFRGNGTAEGMYNTCQALPIQPPPHLIERGADE
jgi:hypothetical protein